MDLADPFETALKRKPIYINCNMYVNKLHHMHTLTRYIVDLEDAESFCWIMEMNLKIYFFHK